MVFAEDLPPCASDDFAPLRLTGNRRARVLVDRLTRGAEIDGGDTQACQVPGEPHGDRAGFSDPGGTALPGPYGRAGAAPACAHGRGSHDETNFGAEWAGSKHTLSTLRPAGRPVRTQDSLPAAGQTLPGGLSAHWVPPKGFFDASYIAFPLSQAYPGASARRSQPRMSQA
jgi:hypothetical protein